MKLKENFKLAREGRLETGEFLLHRQHEAQVKKIVYKIAISVG
jgi:hypothetical protein